MADLTSLFAPVLPPQKGRISNLLLTSEGKADPSTPNPGLQTEFCGRFPLRAPKSCAVAGDADGSASPAAVTQTEESGER